MPKRINLGRSASKERLPDWSTNALRIVTPQEEADYQATLSEWLTVTWAIKHRPHCRHLWQRTTYPIEPVPLSMVDELRTCKACT